METSKSKPFTKLLRPAFARAIRGRRSDEMYCSTINDCWFGGKIIVNSIQAPVGGIIGYAEKTNLANCLVATTEIGTDGLGNTCWLGYIVDTDAKNCFWPNDDKYASSVSNAESGVSAGTAVDNFKENSLLEALNKNAAEGIQWTMGIRNPTFYWDNLNIAANYEAVDEAIAKAEALNKDNYKDFSAVEAAIKAVDRDKNITGQAEVDACLLYTSFSAGNPLVFVFGGIVQPLNQQNNFLIGKAPAYFL